MTRRSSLPALLLATALPAVLAYAQAAPTPPPPAPPEASNFVVSEDEPPPPAPPSEDALPRLEERHVIIQRRSDKTEPAERDVMVLRQDARPGIPPNSAWLGVQLSPVPAALAYHLGLKETGAMVANVFEGSPAEKAGLDRYDVIVKADGKTVAGGMEAVSKFAINIRDKKPGDTLELTVFNQGQEKTLSIELGKSPADWSTTKPKYEEDPDVALQREFGLRGRIMRPGPGGEWIIEDLDQFPDFRQKLEQQLRDQHGGELPDVLMPAPPHEQGQMAIRVDKDGVTLRVQRDLKGGPITVERYKDGADEKERKVTKYDDLDELRQADREAFDLLNSAGQQPKIKVLPRKLGPAPYVVPLPPQPPVAPRVKPAKPAPENRKAQDALREWERGFFQGPLKDTVKQAPAPAQSPKTRFEVAADGKITVHFRDGDSEISRTYNSAEEFRDKAPRLFKQFERLQDRMNAEE